MWINRINTFFPLALNSSQGDRKLSGKALKDETEINSEQKIIYNEGSYSPFLNCAAPIKNNEDSRETVT